ncbi:hypothetical protein WUBG_05945 [Wuchereria bancrofti]|uniref:Glycosyl-hydrolase family 116 catalytic region domain-containing protein n=1 Tax=Wuchereria bancrofti TaxID=6293 RepID=J9EL12_WUCBA|nr:hypothetical protein WUBG_05945 [Wuchereria bancrofti]
MVENSGTADQTYDAWKLLSRARALLPLSHIKSALNQIYSSNILNFAGGRLGAVNGMRKDGTVGRRHLQADEMWVGVTYALQHHLYSRYFY